jgi:hypothetical protein
MGHKKWSNDEELMLIKKIASGQKIETIAKDHDRTIPAVLKRLEKITFENIESGKSVNNISTKLHLKPDVVKKLYDSYKKTYGQKLNMLNRKVSNTFDNNTFDNNKIDKSVVHVGGKKINHNLKKLMLENKVISELILNKNLTKELNDLINSGKIDGNVKHIVKYIRSI